MAASAVAAHPVRPAAVAGAFYPADPSELASLVDALLVRERGSITAASGIVAPLAGLLVPHAGLIFSGAIAAAGWSLAERLLDDDATVVMLGTNHGAWGLDGAAIWDAGAWRTPLGEVPVDEELAADIAALGPPFAVDREAHGMEHSLEVQLPLVSRALPRARIVPISVGAGVGGTARAAGGRLGAMLARRRTRGDRILLAISTDMAHYPQAAVCAGISDELAPAILALDPWALARRERAVAESGLPGVACGMCGIQPSVLGLAALRAMGVERGYRLASATSADARGSPGRTVGYLAVAFPG